MNYRMLSLLMLLKERGLFLFLVAILISKSKDSSKESSKKKLHIRLPTAKSNASIKSADKRPDQYSNIRRTSDRFLK